jgi:sugar lactone lactonase YvrE
MRRLFPLVVAAVAACQTTDLTLPPAPAKPQPGTIYGTVVYFKPGMAAPLPAPGASVQILGTGLTTLSKTDADCANGADAGLPGALGAQCVGSFFLGGITQSSGTILFRWASDGTTVDHQRAIRFPEDIPAGVGQQISLGQVAVTENATMNGRVLLADHPGATTGLGGTTVFVPAGPFTAYTNDDGSYSLDQLPQGVISVSFFRTGYVAYELDNISLQAGQAFTAADVTLQAQAMPPPPGSIVGQISFNPAPASVIATTVAAVNSTGTAIGGSVAANGSFQIVNVPAGVYNVTIALMGYTTDVIDGVLVDNGAQVVLPAITLNAGNGVTNCMPGAACTPTNNCHVGQVSCQSGQAVCMDMGNAAEGAICGAGEVCHLGTCTPCTSNTTCTPTSAPCHTGTTSCATGVQTCTDNGGKQSDGTMCGSMEVCNSGECVSCPQGQACVPSDNACHTGSQDCSTGVPVCTDTQGILSNGSSCGTNQVCNGGTCVACTAGGVCSPVTAVCHKGLFSCNTGVQICIDQQMNLDDGTGCGQDLVCLGGSCVTCVTNAICTPSTNACHAGLTSCATGVSQCIDQNSPAPEGMACGSMLVCHQGNCVQTGFTVVSGGTPSGTVDSSTTPVTIMLANQSGAPIPGATISVAPPPGGAAILPPSARTDVNGQLSFTPVLPREAGTYTYTASSAGQGQIAVMATANAAAPATIYSLVNINHSDGNSGVPGAGSIASVGQVTAMTMAMDGSIYFTEIDNSMVRVLSPAGDLTNIAGTGTRGYSGDGMPAAAAALSGPQGIALDAAHQALYVADTGNNVIRRIDLVSGLISTFAGGGSAPSPGYGDNGPALNAQLSLPTHLAIGPDRKLYVTDSNIGRIRSIDLTTNVIQAAITPTGAYCSNSLVLGLYSCGGTGGCHVAWDPGGNMYVSAQIAGLDIGNNCTTVPGVVRVNSDGSFSPVAGYYQGATGDGAPASQSSLDGPALMAFDSLGNLFLSIPSQDVIKRVDGASGRMTTVAGTSGTAAFGGEFQSPSQALLSSPWGIAVDAADDIFVADQGNDSIREITGPATLPMSTVTLTKTSGDAQSVLVDQPAPAFLTVTLADMNGPLVGLPVVWAAVDPGGAVNASVVDTDGNGVSSVQVTAGRQPGTYCFTATYTGIGGAPVSGSPVQFSLTATAEPSGDIYSLVNISHTSGTTLVPTPGTIAQIEAPNDPWVTSDGTIYFGDSQGEIVWKLSPAGVLTPVAGNGSCGNTGNGGQATAARICAPSGVAVDESTGTLYLSDNSAQVIRAVNLATGVISTIAGGGPNQAPYGDGGPASNAFFQDVSHLTLGPGRVLYVTDYYQSKIRAISLTTGLIQTWLGSVSQAASGTGGLYSCSPGNGFSGCNVVWDASGNAFVSGTVTSASLPCSNVYGILEVASSGATSLIAGSCTGTSSPGAPALATQFSDPPSLALDGSANLILANAATGTIQRIDNSSGVVTTVAGAAGNGTPGYLGNHVAASGAILARPNGLAFTAGGDLIIADTNNSAVRSIAGLGNVPANPVTLQVSSGNMQSVVVDQPVPLPLAAKLSTAAGPLTGFTVQWAAADAGSLISANSGITDVNGISSVTATVGRAAGTYHFTASFNDIHGNPVSGSPVTFTVTASAAPNGDIYTLVNVPHVSGQTQAPTPGTVSQVNTPLDTYVTADGTLYFSDYYNQVVRKLSPAGVLSTVAGSYRCGNTGDGGQATAAQICYPWGVTVDEHAGVLYLADNEYQVIRAVNLTTGLISTIAGGGANSSPYGDGGSAKSAFFRSLSHLAIGPDGQLYVTDYSMNRIRVINLGTNVIQTWLSPPANTVAPTLDACGSGTDWSGCQVTWDAAGNAYVSAVIQSTTYACTDFSGVMEIAAQGGATSLLAGACGNATGASGGSAVVTPLAIPPSIAVDSGGNLYLGITTSNIIQRVDASSRKLTTLAGNGTQGYSGDEVPAAGSILSSPNGLFLDAAGDLIFSDGANNAVRTIAGVSSLPSHPATIAPQGGNNQTVVVDQAVPVPLSVTLSDASGPLTNYSVQWTSSNPGAFVSNSSALTDVNGVSSVNVRAGRAAGPYQFTASFNDIHGNPVAGSPVTFTVHATAAAAGDIYTLVNVAHTQAQTFTATPGTVARLGQTTGIAVATDGTLYISDPSYHRVWSLSPSGLLSLVAGNGGAGLAGMNGPGTAATIYAPYGLAVSSTTLYIADSYEQVIYAVNLSTGIISQFAGGGTATAPTYGDGGPASNAVFRSLTHLAIGPDNQLYVSDDTAQSIRTINLGSNVIQTWQGGNVCSSGTVGLYNCSDGYACSIDWDSAGNAYVSGNVCGTATGGGVIPGVFRINASSGTSELLAGTAHGLTASGTQGLDFQFDYAPAIAVDAAQNVYLTSWDDFVIRRLDHTNGEITTIAGTSGTHGYLGDEVPAAGSLLYNPLEVRIDPSGNLVFSDYNNYAIRTIAGVASIAGVGAVLAGTSGTPAAVLVDQVASAPFTVTLKDGSGNPLVGFGVNWSAVEAGAGVSLASAATDSTGTSTVIGRDGLVPGTYHFTASYADLNGNNVSGSPVTFPVTANAPPSGDIFAILNFAHSQAHPGGTGLATLAQSGHTRDMAVASDGTIYFADYDYCVVRAISPQGVVTTVAGNGSCGFSGDLGPATSAELYQPNGLALDSTDSNLYIADSNNGVVRKVVLSTGTIYPYAGLYQSSDPGPAFGDGGLATAATLYYPTHLAFGPDGNLYITDLLHGKIRYVDSSAVIHTYLADNSNNSTNNCGTTAAVLYYCYYSSQGTYDDCQIGWDSGGNAYVSGIITGTGPSGGTSACQISSGIMRIAASDGSVSFVAGAYQGSAAEGVAATTAGFQSPPTFTFDSGGNMILADSTGNKVRRIDAMTHLITTIAGNGTGAYAGDYVPGSMAQVNQPWMVSALPGGHLAISDYSNFCVREIW